MVQKMIIILINALNRIRIHKIDLKYGNHMFEGNIIVDKHSKSPHTSRKLWQSFRKTVKITFIGVFEIHLYYLGLPAYFVSFL